MVGVFITRGITPSIPVGGLTLSLDDRGESKSNVTLHLHYDVCPVWLDLARRHLADAEKWKDARVVAWKTDDQHARGTTLEREFEASMQAVVAASVAIESLYSTLCEKISLPNDTVQAWKKNGTAKFRRIAEVARRAFSLSEEGSDILREVVHEIFRFRNFAIHPSGNTTAAVLHPELQVGVEWRLATFRADNARAIVQKTQEIIVELITRGKASTPEVARYAESLRDRLAQQATAV